MCLVALIDNRGVIDLPAVLRRSRRERFCDISDFREEGVRVHTGTDPPGEPTVEPWLDDSFPDYDIEPVIKYANG